MKRKVETPPSLMGTAEQQLRTIYSYLFRLAENLNVLLSNLNEGDLPDENSDSENTSISADAYSELRVLIMNTANVIMTQLQLLQQKMALSEKYITFNEAQGVMDVSCKIGCTGLTIGGQALDDYILSVVSRSGE